MRTRKTLKVLAIATLVCMASLALIRCKPNKVTFGYYAGECIGNCGTLYQVGRQGVFIDTTTLWAANKDPALLKIKPQRVLLRKDGAYDDLKLSIPLLMLLDTRDHFGCPDCMDQGGYYLEYTLWERSQYFFIDPSRPPLYFLDVCGDINLTIDRITKEMKVK